MAELQQISLGKLINNTGQIAGVPKNPRQIRNEQYDKLLQSLKESDLTDYKPLMVYPQDGKFIVLGGNMRLRALRELKAETVSCIIVPEGTPAETLRKLVIIDNTEFGEYDWDAIANEWGDLPLDDWGVEMPWSGTFEDVEHLFEDAGQNSKPIKNVITIEVPDEIEKQQLMDIIKDALADYKCVIK